MPHVIELATSGRAKCRGCGERIAKGERRFGERLPNPYADDEGEMTHWFHVDCAAFKRPEPFLELATSEGLAIEDRERLVHEAQLGVAHHRLPRAHTAARAPSGRARCRACREAIDKGAWRISLVYYEEGRFVPSGFIHVRCASSYVGTTAVIDRVKRFSPELGDAELSAIQAEVTRTAGNPAVPDTGPP